MRQPGDPATSLPKHDLQIVLVEPEIPPNTGNIARLCAASGTSLHLVEPLGFSIDDRALRRAGMDYWKQCRVATWKSFEDWRAAHPHRRLHLFTTRAQSNLWETDFQEGDALVFGRETKGLPDSLLQRHPDSLIRIPMLPDIRSLNLATSAGIALYEALRQIQSPHTASSGLTSRRA